MKCIKCQGDIQDGAKFCHLCGTSQQDAPDDKIGVRILNCQHCKGTGECAKGKTRNKIHSCEYCIAKSGIKSSSMFPHVPCAYCKNGKIVIDLKIKKPYEDCCDQLRNGQEDEYERTNTQGERVATISKKLQEITGTYYQAKIIQSNVINAYADGKKIMITSAALDMYNDDELASTLGHEIAHNEAGDIGAGKQRIERAINDVAEAVAETPGFVKKVLVGITAGTLTMLAEAQIRQQAEHAADRRGQEIAEQAGFDPMGAVTGLDKGSECAGGLFSTHPSDKSRKRNLVK